MKGADTLISVRFLTLLGHFSILVTLLWENNENLHHCLPIQSQYPMANVQTHQHWSVAGLATSLALVVVEFTTFIFGLTMFESFVNLTSITGHGIASIILKFYVPDTLLCDWFWPVYFFFSVLPFVFDITTSVANEQQHLTQTHEFKPGWSFYLVLAGVTTTFGSSLPVGFNIGVVNSPAEIIKTFCNESFISRYDLPLDKTWLNVLWSSIVSIFIVGGCTGSILGSCFADKFGRKYATIITNLLSIAGAILFLFCRAANSVEMLILGRLLVGLAGGLTTSIVPMYLTELSPPRLSGAMGVACPIGVNAGVLVGQVMGLDVILGGVDNWPYLLSVFALLVIISLPILFILPESPKYLFVVKRNEPAAIKELSRLRGEIPSVLTEDLELLREEVQAEASTSGEKWGMWRVAREPKLRLPLLLACTMQAGQQTSGINAVFYYSQTIFEQAGLSARAAQLATIGCGSVNVCTALAMLPLLPRAGRRALLLASAAAAALLLAALALAMAYIVRCDALDAVRVHGGCDIVRSGVWIRSRPYTLFHCFGAVRGELSRGRHGVGLAVQLGRELPGGHELPHAARLRGRRQLPAVLRAHRRAFLLPEIVLPRNERQDTDSGGAALQSRAEIPSTELPSPGRRLTS